MKPNKLALLFLALLWLGLAALSWLKPAVEISAVERRPLAQAPELTGKAVLSGQFMTDFEAYSLDQFPFRNALRTMKAVAMRRLFGQRDNHGIYVAQGHAAKLLYPLHEKSVQSAAQKFTDLYQTYLTESRVFLSIIPDKGRFLAEPNGYPALEYQKLISLMQTGMPWAQYVDITGQLSLDSYYRTDPHWRQETLLGVANTLNTAMGGGPLTDTYSPVTAQTPFYGAYFGQAALPMAGESLSYLTSETLENCTVFNWETGRTLQGVYAEERLTGKDPYEVYLYGASAGLEVQNPNARTARELIVFRDSFASSLIPLLMEDYAKITLVDIRYVAPQLLPAWLEFHGQDVLFLYSALLLNESGSLKSFSA